MKNERIGYIQWLRCLAALAVVIMHTEGQFWMSISHETAEWVRLTRWDGLVRWPVPVFIMITGALFLPRRTELKTVLTRYIPRMMGVWCFWSGVYVLWDLYTGESSDWLGSFLAGHYHMWYIPFLVGIYLTLPFLQRIAEDERLTDQLLIVGMTVGLAVPWLADAAVLLLPRLSGPIRTVEGSLNFSFFFDHMSLLLLGHVLCRRELTGKQRRVLYILGLLAAAVTAPATIWASRRTGMQSAVFCDIAAPNVVLAAAALFVFAKYHLTRLPKAVDEIAKCSFGIYLFHPLIIELMAQGGWHALSLGMAVTSLAVFGLSLAVSALLRRVPWLGKHIV